MKHLDEFRDPAAAARLLAEIRRLATRPWLIMEVCGGQTHSLLRHGLEEALAGAVELLHGPGCPVCVTPRETIDRALRLATERQVTLATFGDMLRVPGSSGTLAGARAAGADVRAVYSPLDAVALAEREPARHVTFFAVGFETTAPATALALLQAARRKLTNFSLLAAHVRVQPAMEALLREPGCRVQAFLAAGHVCTVAGFRSYEALAAEHRVPVVVTGFEPLDLLQGILDCVRQLERGQAAVTNQYGRSVRTEGNPAAQRLMEEAYEVCDRPWRGLGVVPAGGLRLREAWAAFDAERRFPCAASEAAAPNECRSGDVLAGRLKPSDCPHFGVRCTPDDPLGAPMVSGEGACAAYYIYRRPLLAQGAGGPP